MKLTMQWSENRQMWVSRSSIKYTKKKGMVASIKAWLQSSQSSPRRGVQPTSRVWQSARPR